MELSSPESRGQIDKSHKMFFPEDIGKAVEKFKDQGKKIGYIEGVWDPFNYGHLEFVEFAKSKCDILVVAVASDEYAKTNKGPNRPIYNLQERSKMLAALSDIDLVCMERNPPAKFGTEEYEDYMRYITQTVQPDMMIVSTKADANPEVKKARAEALGVQYIPYDAEPHLHSTEIIDKLNKYE